MIWVVTNHAGTRESLSPLIRAKGYPVDELECGGEVEKRLVFRTALLIIVDCGVSDSFETLQSIRAQPRATPIPIVMFSVDDQDLKERALLVGADAYVPKGSLDWAELLVEVVRFAGPPPSAD